MLHVTFSGADLLTYHRVHGTSTDVTLMSWQHNELITGPYITAFNGINNIRCHTMLRLTTRLPTASITQL